MKLNLKQKKILKLLSINCRFSNKDIARSVKMSKDSVAYQVEKLIEKEKLSQFSIQFYHPMIGYDSYRIWIRLKENANFEKLKKIKQVHSINKSHGKYDLQILVFAKSKRQFKETLKKIRKVIPIKELTSSILRGMYKPFSNVIPPIDVPVKIPKNSKKFEYVLDGELYPSIDFLKKVKIDETDKKVIECLIKNPRANFQTLAEYSGINHETIRYRMKRMVEEKFISNFGLIHNFSKYGLYVNYFLIDINTKKFIEKEFQTFLKTTKNIFCCAKLEGDYNCIIYVASENPSELGELQSDLMNSLGNSIKKIDLLFMEKILKYEQFPQEIL